MLRSSLIALLFCICGLAISQIKKKPIIQFETFSHNFGTLKEEIGKATHEFVFTNTGNAPLIIQQVTASCGCTTPQWTQKPVPPGASGKITVTYSTSGRPGHFTKTITVRNNSDQTPIQLSINGIVSPRALSQEIAFPIQFGNLRVKSTIIPFGSINQHSVEKRTVPLLNSSDKPIAISFLKMPSHITVAPTTGVIAPGKILNLLFTYNSKALDDLAFRNDKVALVINGDRTSAQNTVFTISAYLTGTIPTSSKAQPKSDPIATLSQKQIKLGRIVAHKKAVGTVTITNSGKSQLYIRKVYSDCNCIDSKLPSAGISPGKSYPMHFSVSAESQPGFMVENVNIMTNSPITPDLQFAIHWETIR